MQILPNHYYYLLCIPIFLAGISSCDSNEFSQELREIDYSQRIKLYSFSDNKPIDTDNNKEIQSTKQANNFSIKKQKKISQIIISNHYKKLNLEIIQRNVKNADLLTDYLKKIDPYSRYISAEKNRFVRKRNKLNRVGIGFKLLINKEDILVVPTKGAALYQSGLKTPQYLLSLNNHKVNYNDFSSYAFLASIGVGDSISLKIKNSTNNREKSYQVKAKRFRQKLINFSENTQFAMVRIDEYKDGMQVKLKQFLKKINNRKPLIIDLRYCPGGDLFAAVDMLSPFIGRSRSIAYLDKETAYQAVSLNTITTKPLFKRPIYMLTSKFTASSAEVFIRGIKHAVKNSYTVGEATQGKCLAQESHSLGDGSALLLSSYKILTPNKKSCEQIPIKADKKLRNIELLDMDTVMNFLE